VEIERYLAKFDRLLENSDHYDRVEQMYRSVFDWATDAPTPFVWSDLPPVADGDWPEYEYNDAFDDMGKMLLSQLRTPFLHLQAEDCHPLAIRANYGTVILPSILGGTYELTETSLPWAHHLPGGRDAIRDLIDSGQPAFRSGLGARCEDTAVYFMETLGRYPNLLANVHIYHPDLQGPFDVAHLLWGPDIFVGLYDCPDLVHTLLDFITTVYIAWLCDWKELVNEGNAFTAHWGFMIRGGAMVRDDTPVMLSQSQYKEFVKPYDQRILDAFGGSIHYCGRGDQFIEPMVESDNLTAIHMSQPDWNDCRRVIDVCRKSHVVLMALDEAYAPDGDKRGLTLVRSWERHCQGEAESQAPMLELV